MRAPGALDFETSHYARACVRACTCRTSIVRHRNESTVNSCSTRPRAGYLIYLLRQACWKIDRRQASTTRYGALGKPNFMIRKSYDPCMPILCRQVTDSHEELRRCICFRKALPSIYPTVGIIQLDRQIKHIANVPCIGPRSHCPNVASGIFLKRRPGISWSGGRKPFMRAKSAPS